MKRLISVMLALTLILTSIPAFANTQDFDFSGLSFDELVAVQEQLTAALWASEEWQEVVVPPGVYSIGDDIPAGEWTITDPNITEKFHGATPLHLSRALDESGNTVAWGDEMITYTNLTDKQPTLTWNLPDGTYLKISENPVIFTPAISASLGFKGFGDSSVNTGTGPKPTLEPTPTPTPEPTATPTPKPTATPTPKPTATSKNKTEEQLAANCIEACLDMAKDPSSIQIHGIKHFMAGDQCIFVMDVTGKNSLGGASRQTMAFYVNPETGHVEYDSIISAVDYDMYVGLKVNVNEAWKLVH